jgi:hypothetical protein
VRPRAYALAGLVWASIGTTLGSAQPLPLQALPAPIQSPEPEDPDGQLTRDHFVSGQGFPVGKSDLGSLSISAYMLVRYINQLPGDQSFVDHLGRTRTIDTRNDFQLQRVLIHLKGYLFDEKLKYQTSVWAVNSTNSVTAIGSLNYEFNKYLTFGGGIGAMPGTRSMNYEHPYFLGTDRQMGDEYFRPGFTAGIWANGELFPGLQYRLMLGDSITLVNISAAQLTRDLAYGGTLAWMPTTHEFGPRGGFGDFEMHEKVATRFGVSSVHSREDRFSQVGTPYPDNTQIRISDGLLLFDPEALAPGVTLQRADYTLLSFDASMKHRGFFLFGEYYFRNLGNFQADGPLPQGVVYDNGFMIQSSYMVVPQRWELYGSYSRVFGAFNTAWELGGGVNFYPYRSRNFKINGTVIYVDRSPTGSLFGYFVGGQKGPIVSFSADFFF